MDPITQLGILASGNGTNFERLARACQTNEIPSAAVACLIADRDCFALERAKNLKVPAFLFKPKDYPDPESWGKAILECLKKCQVKLILLAGFLRKIPSPIISTYPSRILNIHPALLPKYGGKGMYGHYVHQAVIHSKDNASGITVHVVDEEYDHGANVWQEKIPVFPTDTPQTLADRIHEVEYSAYPKAVKFYLEKLRAK